MGIHIKNESQIEIQTVLSELTALHWTSKPIAPGATRKIRCGAVWFTVDANAYDPSKLPTRAGVAGRLTLIIGSTLLAPGVATLPAFALAGCASRATSNYAKTNRDLAVKGAKRNGVYADGKVVVIRGHARPDGVYELYVDRYEWLHRKTGAVVKMQECFPKPAVHPVCAQVYSYPEATPIANGVAPGVVVVQGTAPSAPATIASETKATTTSKGDRTQPLLAA